MLVSEIPNQPVPVRQMIQAWTDLHPRSAYCLQSRAVLQSQVTRADTDSRDGQAKCLQSWPHKLNQRLFRGDLQVVKPICLDSIREMSRLLGWIMPLPNLCSNPECDARQVQSAFRETRSAHLVKLGI